MLPDLPQHPPNPEGLALVKEIKQRISDICVEHGACHMQIGKDYPYLETRKPEVRGFVQELKKLLDPENLMNPGALGLG